MDPLLNFRNDDVQLRTYERGQSPQAYAKAWPKSSAQIRKFVGLSMISEVLFDLLLTITAILFLAFGVLAQLAHERSVESISYAESLLSASRFGPTVFPILYALTAGRLMKAIAAWKIERGANIATLERLLGSRAIGSALITAFQMKSINLLGLALILLWSLSPLGGQASLRTPSLASSPTAALLDFSYIGYNTTYNMGYADQREEQLNIVRAIYSAALIGSASGKQSPQDAWGNVKIPVIEEIPGYDASTTSQWLPVNSSGDVTYSSLVGLPVTHQKTTLNASYGLETMYMSLNCQNLTMTPDPEPYTIEDPPVGWAVVSNFDYFQLATTTDDRNGSSHGVPNVPRPIALRAASFENENNSIATAMCNLTTSNVELNVTCVGVQCSTVAIRASQEPHNPINWSPLDFAEIFNSSYIALSFLQDFVNATVPMHEATSSATEYYLVYPDTPFDPPRGTGDSTVDFSNITNSELSTRLTQLLNSYYLASTVPLAIQGDYSTQDWAGQDYSFRNATGQLISLRTIFVCNQAWLTILLISSLAMMFCGIASIVLGIHRRGPDILDDFSSFTRDNPYVTANVPLGGSNMDGIDRTRHLKDVRVKLGDVALEADVGHIAIGTLDTQNIATLRRGRLYD